MRPTQVAPLFVAAARSLLTFFRLEAASGIVLLLAAAAALVWANSPAAATYFALRDLPLSLGAGSLTAHFTLMELVNDGLMTVFFFVVGMEIKRELAVGELRTPARAALPAVAALGGMIVPAAIYVAFNRGPPGMAGWGIPMATDIAFSIGVLTLLRSRVPHALVVFLTALAIFDDIGGILVIAFFYGHGLHLLWLGAAALVAVALAVAGRLGARQPFLWAAGLAALWYALHHSGIHATIAGVVAGLLVPARSARTPREVLAELSVYAQGLLGRPADEDLEAAEVVGIEDTLEDAAAPLDRFVHTLHPFVAFGIMPLFALANSGVALGSTGLSAALSPVALGVALGLLLGKPIGIFAFTWAAVRLRLAPVPGGAEWGKVLGVAVVAGIGFTVALFIAGLAFPTDAQTLDQARLGILCGSLLAGVAGAAVLGAGRKVR